MKVFLLLTPQTRSPGSLRLLVVLKDFWHLIKRNQIDILNNLNKQTDIRIAPCRASSASCRVLWAHIETLYDQRPIGEAADAARPKACPKTCLG